MTEKVIARGDKVKVHDSVSKYCGMSGTVERVICHGVYSVRFANNLAVSMMLYQISRNRR